MSTGSGTGRRACSPGWRTGRRGRSSHRARPLRRTAGRILTAAAAALAALIAASLTAVPAASASSMETVIITAAGPLDPAITLVLGAGGAVLTQYHLINGAVVSIPASLVPVLDALPGVTVTTDEAVSVQSTTTESTAPHTPSDAFLRETGATKLAASGDTGQGVTVAVVDTGIDNLPDFAGRLAGGVDLTGGNNPFQDSYGHGTFVAGLIAGNGASSNGQYSGEAPGARLVSIKVAGADGVTHLSTLISGLQWGVDHHDEFGIKVVNLSLGFRANVSTVINPLDQAVEAVWRSGITVVASAGNAGPFNGTVLSPGDDPLAITVGASDDMTTPPVTDDEMTNFSSAGPTSPDGWVKPDVVSSGRSVVSLAAPGSTVYVNNPSARVGAANFAGSGTSFSTAIASGAAALVLAAHPGITPNEVKGRLLGTTNPGPVGNPFVDGHGALNAYAAVTSGPIVFNQSTVSLPPISIGVTVTLSPTSPVDTWNTALWAGTSWNMPQVSNVWNGWSWNGGDWNGTTFVGRAWNEACWNGAAWNGADWSGQAWDGSSWNGSALAGAVWNGLAWLSSAWS